MPLTIGSRGLSSLIQQPILTYLVNQSKEVVMNKRKNLALFLVGVPGFERGIPS